MHLAAADLAGPVTPHCTSLSCSLLSPCTSSPHSPLHGLHGCVLTCALLMTEGLQVIRGPMVKHKGIGMNRPIKKKVKADIPLVRLRLSGYAPAIAHGRRTKGLDRAHHSMHVQPLWSLMGHGNDFRLRIYGFTDLPPSLPLLWENPRDAHPKIKTSPATNQGYRRHPQDLTAPWHAALRSPNP